MIVLEIFTAYKYISMLHINHVVNTLLILSLCNHMIKKKKHTHLIEHSIQTNFSQLSVEKGIYNQ